MRKIDIPSGHKSESELRKSWETAFTDPEHHDPNNYCYLVHSLLEEYSRYRDQTAIMKDLGVYDSSKVIDLLTHPERIHDKEAISCSVISDKHNKTFGPVSLILGNVSFESVLSMAPEDIESDFYANDKFARGDTSTVEALLKSTQYVYNEVRIDLRDKKAKVTGVFVTHDAGQENILTAENLAKKLNVPLIVEQKKVNIQPDLLVPKVREKDGQIDSMSMIKDGKVYVLRYETQTKKPKATCFIQETGRMSERSIDDFQELREVFGYENLSSKEQSFLRKFEGEMLNDFFDGFKKEKLEEHNGIVSFGMYVKPHMYSFHIEPRQTINRKTFQYERSALKMEKGSVDGVSQQGEVLYTLADFSQKDLDLLRKTVTTPEGRAFLDLVEMSGKLNEMCDPESESCEYFDEFVAKCEQLGAKISAS